MSDIKKLNVQKKTAQQKGKKKKSDKSNRLVMAAVAVVVAAAVILGVFALSSDKVIKQSGTTSDNSELLSSVSTDEMGFPVTFTNNDIIRAESFSSRIFVLGKKIFTCLTDSGKVRYSRIFSFTQPEMTVSEKFGLVYDRASSKYFIFNRDGVIYEGETENKKHIITAKINNRGDVAFVTKSDDSACRVSLTDKKGKILYIWSCAEEYGVSVDLSEDSREIVCGSIGSENGTVYSKVYLLSTYSDEDAQECRIDG
ncbi:MAG: hypothetical protein IKV21_04640, partial [Clostridia bacterium]|nr:hypothetical protein [Clostridia bacterium]